MVQKIETNAVNDISQASSSRDLDLVRVKYLGKKGEITIALKGLSSLSIDEKKSKGKLINEIRLRIQTLMDEKKIELEEIELKEKIEKDSVDITLPVSKSWNGGIHPITSVMREIKANFLQKGFSLAEGPEIEDEYHNFDALNIPEHHPARQNHDTFYFEDGRLLRTHTSTVQIRASKVSKPPMRILSLGRVYRSDYDATHSPMFHQCEGLVVEKGLHMGHLKGTIIEFCKSFFGKKDLKVRFRPSFFPFTEPSAEVDIAWDKKTGEVGKGDDWLEVLGCGMVHPNVLRNCGVETGDGYNGFAFGLGIERFTMLKFGIKDLRSFYQNDMPWLENYNYSPQILKYLG